MAVDHDQFRLSPREVQVLCLVVEGKRNKEIADILCVAQRTVEHHVENIMHKLGAHNRTEAAMRALEAGLVSRDRE